MQLQHKEIYFESVNAIGPLAILMADTQMASWLKVGFIKAKS